MPLLLNTLKLLTRHTAWVLLFVCTVGVSASAQSPIEQAKALFEKRDFTGAATTLKKVKESDASYAEAQYWLGRCAFAQKEYDDASDYFEEAVEADPKKSLYYQWLGDSYGTIAQDANPLKQGMLAPKMKSAWEKAIALDPGNINARLSLVEYYAQAPSIVGGSMEKARATAKEIIALNPAQGHRSMGNLLVREKKYAEAEKEYLAMVKAEPKMYVLLMNFYVSQQQYDKAFAYLDAELRAHPDDKLLQYQVGKLCALSGKRAEDGIRYLQAYLKYTPQATEPSHAGAQMRLGQILEKQGKKAEAKQYYQSALSADASLQDAKDGLARTSK